MDFRTAFKYSVLTAAVLLFGFTAAKAAGVSKDELKKVEKQVLEQSLEHKKLQAQATQINLEISAVNKEMIKTAKKIQNNEDRLTLMENQLTLLEKDLQKTQETFTKEDIYLIDLLAALQNLAMKPTESLLVQPLSPVEIIRRKIWI